MNIESLTEAWASIATFVKKHHPKTGVILGSGWSDAVDRMEKVDEILYSDIPHLGNTGVVGHAGKLAVVKTGQENALIFQGRRHFYEGEGWLPIAIPVFIMKQAGIRSLLLTNAAGGVRDDLKPGSLMVITDHINHFNSHPLIGPHLEVWGERFPDQSEVYDHRLRDALLACGRELDINLAEGVYLASSGPTYETPAEVRCYRTWGADAVGMSTIPEAMLASAAGIRVAGLSCISNWAAGISGQPLSHAEVTETASATMPAMETLVKTFLERITD